MYFKPSQRILKVLQDIVFYIDFKLKLSIIIIDL